MSKLRDLVSRGVRLIVADAPDDGMAPAPADEDVFPPETFEAPAPPPPESAVPANVETFDAVYEEAGIRLAEHGYGIDKVAEMLDNRRLAPLSREVKASAVMAALEAAGVAVVDVLQDAVRRDRALDAFEAAKAAELEAAREQGEARIQSLRDEIDTFLREKNAEIEGIREAIESATKACDELRNRKAREEDRLHQVVAHFVEPAQNPITRGAPSPAATTAPPEAPPPATPHEATAPAPPAPPREATPEQE